VHTRHHRSHAHSHHHHHLQTSRLDGTRAQMTATVVWAVCKFFSFRFLFYQLANCILLIFRFQSTGNEVQRRKTRNARPQPPNHPSSPSNGMRGCR
jgi:hypothetical protein